ncbi:MAG: type II secretion system F family protein [Thaumarchaeota archaeon]|nr:type II secretion system F family protein [Nitrososphaerota archaeon]
MSQTAVLAAAQKKAKPEFTGLDRFSGYAFKLFGKQGRGIAALFPDLRDEIKKSDMRITPEGLASTALLVTLIAGIITSGLAVVGAILRFYVLVAPIAFLPVIFFLVMNAPTTSQSSRSSALDNEFPFVMGFMEILAGGGISAISALRRIANAAKVFPAAAKEAKRILVDIDVFGMDPITAIEEAAQNNPHKAFAEFLYGYTTALKTGGDVVSYVSVKLRETFDKRASKIRRTSDTIGTLAEAYVTVTAVLGITLFTLYQVQVITARDQAGLTSIFMFSFLVVPLISGVWIWLLNGLAPRQPYLDTRPFKAFFASIPVGIALFLVPIPVKLHIHVSIALISMVIVPAILATKYSRERRGLEKALPEFIRDVSEGRKIGLPPEGAIEQLANKKYGGLSKSVKRMGSQLSWGLTIAKVISTFTAQVNSWITKVVGTLMVEVVDVGGGTVKSFSEMADFTRKVNDMESDQRSALKPYVFVTYMAGLLLVITTFLMVFLLSQPAALSSGLSASASAALLAPPPETVEALLTSAIFESFVVGLVAGKMGEGSVAEGFKHALILVLLSVMTVLIAGTIVPTSV